MADVSKSVDDEIDKAINITEHTADDSLAKLKAQLGLDKDNQEG